jgi:hypothetical protein
MVRLSREIIVYMTGEYGTPEVLKRLSDPFWRRSTWSHARTTRCAGRPRRSRASRPT